MNVNSTGAKAIKYRNGYLPEPSSLAAGRTYAFVYDGTNYQLIGDLDTNTTYGSLSLADVTAGTSTESKLISASVLKNSIESYGYSTTTGTVTNVATGAGLTGGPITSTGTIKANLLSETKSGDTAAAGINGDAKRLYAIALDNTGKLAVNVPWVNTTYSNATQSIAGLMSAADKTKLDSVTSGASVSSISAGIGLTTANGSAITTSGTIKTKLKSETALTNAAGDPTNTANRTYPVAVDSAGNLAVNIPWSNTTYGALTVNLIDAGTDTANRVVSAKVFKDALTSYMAANDAMIFKGTLGEGGTITSLPTAHKAGWTYKVITADTYNGHVCEVGDLIICIADSDNNNSEGDWVVAQANLDGAVIGPTANTVVDGNVAVFNGTSGKLIKRGTISTTSVIKTAELTGGAVPTLGTAISIPNVTGNTSVTVKSVKTNTTKTLVKTISQASSTSSVIGTVANGVLTFSKAITAVGAVTAGSTDTASLIVTEDKTASNTTLGTAISVPNVTSAGSLPTLTTTTQTVVTGIS